MSTKSKAQELSDLVNGALGKGTVGFASDHKMRVEYHSTNLLPFDVLLQGGMPSGRFVELIGDYSTLKSYLGLCSIAAIQAKGGTAALIDTEHAFDPSWAESLGVKLDQLIVERPETGELAIDIMQALIAGGVDLIVVDSIAATLPADEQQKRMHGEKIQPGRLAALMSAGLRRLMAGNKHTAMLWINQTRLKIGVSFGSPQSVPGGKAMPYYASFRVEVKKVGKETRSVKQYDGEKWVNGKEQIGQKFMATMLKSKLSRPFRDVYFTWSLDANQIDIPSFLIAQGVEAGIVEQKGNTWTYGKLKAVGRAKFADALAASDSHMRNLENDIREFHDLPALPQVVSSTRKRGTRGGASKARRTTSTSSPGKKPTARKSQKAR